MGKQAEFKLGGVEKKKTQVWGDDNKREICIQSNALISIFSDPRLYSLVSDVFSFLKHIMGIQYNTDSSCGDLKYELWKSQRSIYR